MGPEEIAEPLVGPAGVVDGQVQNNLHVPLMAERQKRLQVLRGAEGGIHGVVVVDVVFVVGVGGEDGGQPQSLHAQAFAGAVVAVVEVVHPVDDAPQVSDAVSVGVGEGAHKDLIEDPGVVGGGGGRGQSRIGQSQLAGIGCVRGAVLFAACKETAQKQQRQD